MKKKSPANNPNTSAIFEELEPRVLFSAGVEGIIAGDVHPQGVTEFVVDDNLQLLRASNAQPVSKTGADQRTLELVFVDAATPDREQLLDDLINSEESANRQFEVIELSADRDGVLQISETLQNYRDVDAVHIISHGADGNIKLGDTTLNADNLAGYQNEVSNWGNALDADADILIYGCDLAASETGQAFLDRISTLSGADIAASDDLTGSAALGGDWSLEYHKGQIDAHIAFSGNLQQQWLATLATFTVDTDNDIVDGDTTSLSTFNASNVDGLLSLREAIELANNSGSADTITFNIVGSGLHTINLSSALPTITGNVIIDGWSDPDFVDSPVIRIDGAVAGNGVDGNGVDGIKFSSSSDGSSVRGLMITRFTADGILVELGADNISIAGNWIGTDGTTSSAMGNGDDGLDILGSNVTIGGTGVNDGNVITNSGDEGISIVGTGVTSHIIQGNYIGLNVDGSAGAGNNDVGIAVISGSGNTIGGTTAAARNVISNNYEGIEISTDDNVVQGNYIGTDPTGLFDRGNRLDDGLELTGNASDNTIGGVGAGEGNLIAYNYLNGVNVASGDRNEIRGNSIHANSLQGIGLVSTANESQNDPLLSSSVTASGDTTIGGTISSTNSTLLSIDFYASPNGDGEGKIYLGSDTVTTDASGFASFSTVLAGVTVPAGYDITATATSPAGSTSEFSAAISADSYIIEVTTTSNTVDGTTSSINGLANNRGTDQHISLEEAIRAANNTSSTDVNEIRFNLPVTDPGYHDPDGMPDSGDEYWTIDVPSALSTIIDAVVLDATSQPGFSGTPLIQLDGGGTAADGFLLGSGSDGSSIRGFAISNFVGDGIKISSANNLIAGNYIGTDVTGTADAGNGGRGVTIDNGGNNIIGGTTSADRNVISGNANAGIFISGATTQSNYIYGNYIGTNATGDNAIRNTLFGVQIDNGAYANHIGGSAAGQGNLISGNGLDGVHISDFNIDGTRLNVVSGNLIGTDYTGNQALTGTGFDGNGGAGVWISSFASENTIGGTSVGARNIISGNVGAGVYIREQTGVPNTISGNYIGTNIDGTAAVGNLQGIEIDGAANTFIGGTTAATANVISGNRDTGIVLTGAGASNNTLIGNYIGTNAAGTGAIANINDGVRIVLGAHDNTIGGNSTAGEGNLISGNGDDGIEINDAGSNNNLIYGNYIGTDHTGNNDPAVNDLGNDRHGVVIYNGSQDNVIGGIGTGQGNVISGNAMAGVVIDGNRQALTSGNIVSNNHIGINADGTTALANGSDGIQLSSGANGNTIGGLAANAGNVISGNVRYGINTSSASNGSVSADNLIAGNYVGLNAAGTSIVVNAEHAIRIAHAVNTIIGSAAAVDRNVIAAASGKNSINLSGSLSDGTVVQGNYVGTDHLGTTLFSSGSSAISISEAANTTIGGDGSGEGNVVAGYSVTGIGISGAASSGSIVQGNYIGTDTSGTLDLTTGIYGVSLQNGATDVQIGGVTANAGNTIAFNNSAGIFLFPTAGADNPFLRNQIYSNGALGIDLSGDGITPNDADGTDDDIGANNLQNFAVLTAVKTDGAGNVSVAGSLTSDASTTYRIEFFANATEDTSGHGEAEVYLGFTTVTTNNVGFANVNASLSATIPNGYFVTSTATVDQGSGNYGATSEFSANRVAVSEAPVVTLPGSAVSYFENAGAVVIDSGATVTDPDSPDFNGGTVTIDFTAGSTANDRLAILNEGTGVGQIGFSGSNITHEGTIIGSFTGGTDGSTPLVITFNSNSTATNAQALLRHIIYENVSEAPSEDNRAVRFVLTDGYGGESDAVVQTVSVAGQNDAPVFHNLDGSPIFTENQSPVVLDSNVTVTDAEIGSLDNFGGTTLTLLRNVAASSDDSFHASGNLSALTEGGDLTLSNTVVGSVTTNSAGSLVLTFGASATYSQVNEVLQSIGYSNSNDTPPVSVQIDWTFNDGNTASAQGSGGALTASGSTTIDITAVNDAPVLTDGLETSTFKGGSARPFNVNFGTWGQVSDVDSADFDGGTLTASISAGGQAGDSLSLVPSGAGPLTLSGSNDVRMSGVTVGTWSGGAGGAALVVNFNANADVSAVQAVYRAVAFSNNSTYPVFGLRTLSVVVTDGDDGTSNAGVGKVELQNKAPTASNLSEPESYTEDTPRNLTDIVITDGDSATLTATLTLSNAAAGALNTGTSNAVTSSYHANTGVWSASGAMADVNALLSSLTFTPTLDYNADFTIATSVSDGSEPATTGNKAFIGDAVNDAPVASGSATLAPIDEDTSSPAGATVSALFAANFSDGMDQVVAGSSANTFAGIAISSHTADLVKGNWEYSTSADANWISLADANTVSAITLNGADLLRFVPTANYAGAATALAANLIESGGAITSGATLDLSPNGATGGTTRISSANVALGHTVNPDNDAPVLTAGATLTYSEGGAAAVIDDTITIVDVDSNVLVSATIQITGNRQAGGVDVLSRPVGGGISGMSWIPSTGTLTLTGDASVAQYEAALRTVTFVNNSESPSTLDRTITWTVNDGVTDSSPQTSTVKVTAVNDAPVLDNNTLTVNEGQTVDITSTQISATDVDNTDAEITFTISSLTHGQFERTSTSVSTSAVVTSFTQEDITNNAIRFVHDGSENAPAYQLTVSDGSPAAGAYSSTVTFNANVNDDPMNDGSLPTDITVTEDVLSNVDLSAIDLTDVDAGTGTLTLTLTTSSGGDVTATAGTGIAIGGSSTALTLTGTLTDLNNYLNNAANLQYLHGTAHSNGNDADTIQVEVNDNGNTGSGGGANINLGSINVDITPINDAPTLSGANDLTPIAEDEVSNSGTLVLDLISGQVSDNDASALTGIAVVGVDNTSGAWEYSIDGGLNWLSLGAPTDMTARLLAADASTFVRFVPSADYNGTVTGGITFRAWDQTTGNNGDQLNISGFDSGGDSFDSVSYSNNDGTTNWTSDWIESDNNGGGASGGFFAVTSDSRQLQLAAGDAGDNIYREIDTSGATTATLSFDYQNLLSGEDEIRVQVSGDGGLSYTPVYTLTGTTNTGSSSVNIDISSYTAADTRIRFFVFKNDKGDNLYIDNVAVTFDNGDPAPGGVTAFSSATASSDVIVTAVNDAPLAQPDPAAFNTNLSALGPVAYWRLGEATGSTAVDEMGNHDGIYSGPILGATGIIPGNDAAEFDGVDDYVDVGNFDVDGTGLTLMGWFNADDFDNTDQRIASKAVGQSNGDHSWMLSTADIDGEHRLRLRVQAGGVTTELLADSGALNSSQWYFAAATYDAATGEMKLYLNGVEVGSRTHSVGGAVDTDNSVPVYIGANPSNQYQAFDGRIDDVAIFDKALTDGDIHNLYAIPGNRYGVAEDNALVIGVGQGVLANDSDVDGNPLTAVLDSDAGNGSVTLNNDGSFTYTPNADFHGTDTFTYQANDGSLNSNVATVAITVTAVADTPSVTDAITDEDVQTTSGLVITQNTVDGAEVTHFRITNISGGRLYQNSGTSVINEGDFISAAQGNAGLRFTPGANFNGNASFDAQAATQADAVGLGGNSVTATITVNSVNDNPVARDDGLEYPLSLGPTAYWRLGESTGSTAVDETGNHNATYNGAMLGATGIGTGDTAADFDGIDDYVDAGVIDVNGTGLTLSAWFNADDFETSDQRLISRATGSASQDHLWMLSTDDVGSEHRLRLRISAGGTTDTLVASSGDLSTGQWHFASATYDAASGEMKLLLDGVEVGSAIHSVGGALDTDATTPVYIGANPANGYGAFDGRIDDVGVYNYALSAAQIQTLFVPGFDKYIATEDTALIVNAGHGLLSNDMDVDGDALNVSAVNAVAANVNTQITLSSGALLSVNADGSFAYDPNGQYESLGAGDSTTDTFSYTVSDGNGGSDSATVTIAITGVNDAPLATADNFAVNEGATIALNLAANDGDVDDGLDLNSITLVSGPANGTIVVNTDGTVDFSHDGSETVGDSFTYTINDANGTTSNVAAVSLTVTPQNDAPTLNDQVFTVTENSPTGFAVGTVAFSDPDAGDSHSFSITGGTGAATFTIDSITGEIKVADNSALDFELNPALTLTIQVTDDGTPAQSSFATITINLIDIAEFNVSPVGDADSTENIIPADAAVGAPVGITVTAEDADANDTITYSLDDDAGGLFAIDSTTGVVTLNAPLDAQVTKSYAIVVRAVSTDGSSSIQSFTIVAQALHTEPNTIIDIDTSANHESTTISPPINSNSVITTTFTTGEESGSGDKSFVASASNDEDRFDRRLSGGGSNDGTDEAVSIVVEKTNQQRDQPASESVADFFVPTESANVAELKPIVVDFKVPPAAENPNRKAAPAMDSVALNSVMADHGLWEQLEKMQQQMGEDFAAQEEQELIVKIVAGSTLTASAGFVTWLLRGGSLLASFLSTMPLWKGFDPLPILATKDEIITGKRAANDAAAPDKNQAAVDRLFQASKEQLKHEPGTP